MAHSRSALKRLRQSIKARTRNRSAKSRTRTLLTKALTSVDADAGVAETAVREAVSALDRAAQKGIIHKNAAARSKSRLLKRFNQATANAVAAAAGATPDASAATPKPAPRKRATKAAEEKPKPKPRAPRKS